MQVVCFSISVWGPNTDAGCLFLHQCMGKQTGPDAGCLFLPVSVLRDTDAGCLFPLSDGDRD